MLRKASGAASRRQLRWLPPAQIAWRTTETLPVAISRLLARPGDLVQAQGYVLATLLVLLTVSAIAAVDGLRPDRLAI